MKLPTTNKRYREIAERYFELKKKGADNMLDKGALYAIAEEYNISEPVVRRAIAENTYVIRRLKPKNLEGRL
jgi:hypothetical protein